MEFLELVQQRAMGMMKGLENLSYVEGELSLFSLEKRQLRRNLINVCQYLKRECQGDGGRLSDAKQ